MSANTYARLLVTALLCTSLQAAAVAQSPVVETHPAAGPVEPAAKMPQRIIALAPHLVENLYSIGAGERIVGSSDYADYPPAALKIPRVSHYSGVDIEKILSLKPDLILAWRSGTPAADLTRMQQLGLPVVVTDIRDLTELGSHIQLLGQLTGTSARADLLAKQYLQQLEQLKLQYQHAKAVPTFYELWGNPLTTAANQAWPAQQLQLCGASNVFAAAVGDYPQIGLEQVLVRNPALIIQPISANEKRQLVNWQQWPAIKAVQQQQIIQPNADVLHRTTLRMLPGLKQLCQQIDQVRQRSSQPKL